VGLKVTVSDQEASSGDREGLPVGKYHCAITDVRLDSPSSGDNIGKPMLVFDFTVQDSELHQPAKLNEFKDRHIFTNACIWEGALYTIVGILKAMGKYEECLDANGELDVQDDPDYYIGEQMFVRRATNNKQRQKFPDNPDYWIQASGFSALKSKVGASAGSSDNSLLP
jgi:hypothetical protein